MVFDLAPPQFQNLIDQMGEQYTFSAAGFTPFELLPQHPTVPMKFPALRKAIARVLDRQRIVDTAFLGITEPRTHATILTEAHPFGPPKDMLTRIAPEGMNSGDPEGARQLLEDAGWGWDGDDNLHYPPDADLTPLWPKGEEPSPEDFPCLNELF